ncbi:MAG TPA: nitroreductase, partial [Erysipelotrichaceae bacterium]|nr:nitroreductase [Erysipelotrichaceae bacterium]
MNAEKAILTRRSTREFKDLPLTREALERIVEAGRHAPSGGNSQCTHFFVISDQKLLKELAVKVQDAFAQMELKEGMYKSLASSIRQSKTGKYVFHYSPAALIVTASKKDYGNNIADCACALENMMILVNEMDL